MFVAIGGNDATHFTRLGASGATWARALDDLLPTGAARGRVGPGRHGDAELPAAAAPDRRLAGPPGGGRHPRRRRGPRPVRGARCANAPESCSRSAPETFFSEDDFHPGPAGYAAWAEAIYPVLGAALDGGR